MKYISLILCCMLMLAACDNKTEVNLLTWNDSDRGIKFEVFERTSLVKTNSYLRIGDREELIDDDAVFSVPRLLKIDEWLLVLNGSDVWAGYNYSSDILYGEGDWDDLPFTLYLSGGLIVSEERVRANNESIDPANWPGRQQDK